MDLIPHKVAVLQTELNRQLTPVGSTGNFQVRTKMDKTKRKQR